MNKVSVILPVYNGERFLKKAIESVLRQTYDKFELLIFNDGSTDGTGRILRTFKDKRIHIFEIQENKGIVYALNFLISKSNGEFIARIDGDDIWYPQKLEKQINYLTNNPRYYMVAAFARLIGDNGKDFNSSFKQYSCEDMVKKFLPNSNFIIHSSVVMRKLLFDKVGTYRNKYLHTEDYDLWLRMLEKNIAFKILKEVLLYYRVSRYSVNYRHRKEQSKNVIRLKYHYWRKNGFKLFYIKKLLLDFYYLLFPYWVLQLKRRIFNNSN